MCIHVKDVAAITTIIYSALLIHPRGRLTSVLPAPKTRSLASWCCTACTPPPCRSCCPCDPPSSRTSPEVSGRGEERRLISTLASPNSVAKFQRRISKPWPLVKGRRDRESGTGSTRFRNNFQHLDLGAVNPPTDLTLSRQTLNSQGKERVDGRTRHGREAQVLQVKDDGLSVQSPDEPVSAHIF